MSDFMKPLSSAASDRELTKNEAEAAFQILFEGAATPAQIGGFLMALRTRGETVTEFAAAASVMRAKCNAVSAPADAMDIVGTGGDGKGSCCSEQRMWGIMRRCLATATRTLEISCPADKAHVMACNADTRRMERTTASRADKILGR